MKTKNILTGAFALALLGLPSCSEDFLDENYTTGYTTQYLESEEGLIDLSTSLYGNLRYHFAYGWSHGFTTIGVDEFSIGTDYSSQPWNLYDSRLGALTTGMNANVPKPSDLWDQMYYGIASSNTIIANSETITDEDARTLAVGEAYFLRGYNYFRLVSHFGGVVLKTTPSVGVERSFTRASAEECTNSLIEDLRQAYTLLPDVSPRGYGGWVKATAGHFLAKALLFRCSERNDDWNSAYKSADLTEIVTVCDYVIGARPLATDFRDLWNWTGIDCEAEKLPEFLLVALFNGDASTKGRFMNQTFSHFTSQFSNYAGGWVTRGVSVGLDFQRCRPTEYNYSTYDKVNDSRFWKSFKTTYNANTAGNTKKFGTTAYNTAIGDLAIMFIVNEPGDTRFDGFQFGRAGTGDPAGDPWFVNPETGKEVPGAFIHYEGGVWQYPSWKHEGIFASISKYEDGSRTGEKNNGNRDGVLARTGETYLIKAEALVRQGKYADAIAVVNQLRARAQYKAGEDRSLHTDGTQAFVENALYTNTADLNKYKAYSTRNTYYLSTGIAETTAATDLQIAGPSSLPAQDEAILAQLGATTDYDRMLNFILNERTRELNGEFIRWEDLSRTKLLVKRAYLYNAEVAKAAALKEYHLLRPIPQTFIDGMLNEDGSALTSEQRKALQNPGY